MQGNAVIPYYIIKQDLIKTGVMSKGHRSLVNFGTRVWRFEYQKG